jgi:hypothetical protein
MYIPAHVFPPLEETFYRHITVAGSMNVECEPSAPSYPTPVPSSAIIVVRTFQLFFYIKKGSLRTLESLIITDCFNTWLFINNRPSKLPGFKTLTLVLVMTMPMSPYSHEVTDIEPSDIPSRTLTWKPLAYLSHIKRRSNDDRFSASQLESLI